MIVKMKKLSLVAMKSDADSLAKDLVWLSCVEPVRCEPPEGDAIVGRIDCEEKISSIEYERSVLSEAIRFLTPMRKDKKKIFKTRKEIGYNDFMSLSADESVEKAKRAIEIRNELEKIKTEKNRLSAYITSLDVWSGYELPLGFEGTQSASVQTGTLPVSCDTDKLSVAVSENCKAAQIGIINRGKSVIYICAVCHRSCEKQLSAILGEAGFIKNSFPQKTGLASNEITQSRGELGALDDRRKKLSGELEELSLSCPDMETASDLLKEELEKENTKKQLLTTGYTVALSAWIPENKTEKLKKKLSKYVCFCEFSDPEEGENIPVELKNNGFASPFEFVVGMYSYPKYGAFDPTFWTALFFSLIFGMMFADVGYGLMLIVLGFGAIKLMKPKEGAKKLFKLLIICGIACIICGVLFGGYFGDLPAKIAQNLTGSHKLDNLAILCNPLEDPVLFLVMSLAVGAVHLMCGMAINMYMLFKRGNWQAAIFDVGSWFVIFIGAGLGFGLSWKPGVYIMAVGFAMMILMRGRDKKNIFSRLFSGIAGLYDIVNYLSDVLSYSRIFALALAGAVIASVVNTFATLSSNPVATVIAVIIVGTFGHLFNLALSALGAFVHSCRLQYIEFYGKFYEDGGRHFNPVSPDLKYTDVIVGEKE